MLSFLQKRKKIAEYSTFPSFSKSQKAAEREAASVAAARPPALASWSCPKKCPEKPSLFALPGSVARSRPRVVVLTTSRRRSRRALSHALQGVFLFPISGIGYIRKVLKTALCCSLKIGIKSPGAGQAPGRGRCIYFWSIHQFTRAAKAFSGIMGIFVSSSLSGVMYSPTP